MLLTSTTSGFQTSLIQDIQQMNRSLEDLQRQLGTGLKSETWSGLGNDRRLTLDVQGQYSTVSTYRETINSLSVRFDFFEASLTQMTSLMETARGTLDANGWQVAENNLTSSQLSAENYAIEAIGVLNADLAGRYYFGGSDTIDPPVTDFDIIMNGTGTQAGLNQIIDERYQADLGADGRGRLAITAPALDTVSLAEDVAGSPFGFKITSISTDDPNLTVAGPAGTPPEITMQYTGNATNGGNTRIDLLLPDGTTESVELTSVTGTAGDGQFNIGTDANSSAANLMTALDAAIQEMGPRSLRAASAMAAGDDFFNTANGAAPQRVDGPPYDTATAQIDGTSADTVIWYNGENGTGSARDSVSARVDTSIEVDYGARANETGLRAAVQNLAVFSTLDLGTDEALNQDFYKEITDRVYEGLGPRQGTPSVEGIRVELAAAYKTTQNVDERHRITENSLLGILDETLGVNDEEVSVKILALQTRLDATYRTTSILLDLTLADYI